MVAKIVSMTLMNPGNWTTRKLENHVENRTCITLKNAELNLFETHQMAEKVELKFSDPVLASMLMGKKVMHLSDSPEFSFLPGESVIMPADEKMIIDFPEAAEKNPTKCLALRFDQDKISDTINELNLLVPKQDNGIWSRDDYNFHFTNDIAINQILQRLIFIFTENHPSKELFSEMMIREMIIRILQIENKNNYINRAYTASNSSRFSFVIDYIRKHISEAIQITTLSRLAGMSDTSFFKSFKNELGITPNEFIIQERMRHAESLLKNPNVSIKEAYLSSGFNSFSYFCRQFKKIHNINPSEYKAKSTFS